MYGNYDDGPRPARGGLEVAGGLKLDAGTAITRPFGRFGTENK